MQRDQFLKMNFFVKPCITCKNIEWESDGDEYSSYSWAFCKYIDDETIKKVNYLKTFPYNESPKKCSRKNYYEFDKNFDTAHECDFFNILQETKDVLNIKWGENIESPKFKLARRIATGLADFNFKMRNLNRV